MSTTQPLRATQFVDDELVGIKTRYADWGMSLAFVVAQGWIQTTSGTARWDKVGTNPGVDDTRELYLALNSLGANAEIADPDFDGDIIIDWEGDFIAVAYAGRAADPTAFDLMLADAIALVEFVQAQRPKARVSFYDLPMYRNSTTEAIFYARMRGLITLIDKLDFIHPVHYHYLPREMDAASRIYQMDVAIAVANNIDWPDGLPSGGLVVLPARDIIVAVSHRVAIGNTGGPVEESESSFLTYVNSVMDHTYGGFSATGLLEWHGDRYYISNAWDQTDGSEGPPYRNTGTRWDNIRAAFGADGFSWSSTESDITSYLLARMPEVYTWMLSVVSQINTQDRRASVASVARPWRPRCVVPDSSIDRYDRAMIGWSYSGIDFTAAGDGGGGYFAMSYHGLVTPNISGNI